MKKMILYLIVAFLMMSMVALTGCGQTKSQPDSEMTDSSNVEHKIYNKQIYDGEYVTIECVAIYGDRIEFAITSKLKNNNISFDIEKIALDGVAPDYQYSENSFVDIEPGKTVTAEYSTFLKYSDHKLLSGYFYAYNEEGVGIEEIDIVDFDLGGNENIEPLEPEGTLAYNSKNLSLYYCGASDYGICVRVKNKMNQTIYIIPDVPFVVNGKEYGDYSSAENFPAHSLSNYYIDMMSYDPDYNPDDVKSLKFSGVIADNQDIESFVFDSKKVIEEENPDSSDGEEVISNDATGQEISVASIDRSSYVGTYYNDRFSERYVLDGNRVEVYGDSGLVTTYDLYPSQVDGQDCMIALFVTDLYKPKTANVFMYKEGSMYWGNAEINDYYHVTSVPDFYRLTQQSTNSSSLTDPAIGMTAEEVRASTWGKPEKINKTTYTFGVKEQWIYGDGRYIYLTNGIVTAIQE